MLQIDHQTNYIKQGDGKPVILVHGVAASLHDWDDFVPELASNGYAAYALDLLGHGESPKPDSRAYHIDWLFDHFAGWIDSLELPQTPVLVGHSLGGYLSLEYARRFPARTRGLILVDPFYRLGQLPPLLRFSYRKPAINITVVERTPEWLFRVLVDYTSLSMGYSLGGMHGLSERIRRQTALDYTRTAPGVYNVPNTMTDLTSYLPGINIPALVLWGNKDQALATNSFDELVSLLPDAKGKAFGGGHVIHQSNVKEFNQEAMEFLKSLG